jgi:hypothetical protein
MQTRHGNAGHRYQRTGCIAGSAMHDWSAHNQRAYLRLMWNNETLLRHPSKWPKSEARSRQQVSWNVSVDLQDGSVIGKNASSA